MGVKVTAALWLDRQVLIYCNKIRGDLSLSAITELFKSCPNQKQFVASLFEPSISVGYELETFIWYLNQISGPSLSDWKLLPSIAKVDGTEFHKCWLGPDQWLNRTPFNKESESCCLNGQYQRNSSHQCRMFDVGILNGSVPREQYQHLSKKRGIKCQCTDTINSKHET